MPSDDYEMPTPTPSPDGDGENKPIGTTQNKPVMATFMPSQMAPTPGGDCSDPVMAFGQVNTLV